MTERKEVQAELERLVAERTAKLQELVGELEHFSYTITHDMRAPLRAMQGFAEMMAEACGGVPGAGGEGFLGADQNFGEPDGFVDYGRVELQPGGAAGVGAGAGGCGGAAAGDAGFVSGIAAVKGAD